MKKLLAAIFSTVFFAAMTADTFAGSKYNATFTVPSYVGKKVDTKEMMTNLLEDVYKEYGVEGLKKLNAAETRDELIIILGSLKESKVAQDLIAEALPTRIMNDLVNKQNSGVLTLPIVDVSVFEQIEKGVELIDWGITTNVEACDIHCMPCCPC